MEKWSKNAPNASLMESSMNTTDGFRRRKKSKSRSKSKDNRQKPLAYISIMSVPTSHRSKSNKKTVRSSSVTSNKSSKSKPK